ncbi:MULTISPECIES: hypothetical protein [unclassified Carboxylicivirga]|uniref:hypothetical protein n=1 Tax=Carboxylicivirga TaxID=1628153 RepID=UPI003D346AF5
MQKRIWQDLVKLLVIGFSVAAYIFITIRLIDFGQWHLIGHTLSFSIESLTLLLTLLVLWFINLFCEAAKWQVLMRPFISMSYLTAWRQVLAGTTTAVGSPMRMAEMVGRMVLLPKSKRLEAAVMTTVGGAMQNVVILISGVLAFFHFPLPVMSQVIKDHYFYILTSSIIILCGFAGLLFYFRDKIRYYIFRLAHIRRNVIFIALFWTSVRLLVFIFQLFLWMRLWDVYLTFSDYLPLACLYFFFITLLPSHILIDMGIRGSIALFLFSFSTDQTPLILLATFSLWLSNVVVPTLLGGSVLIKQNTIKQG